MKELFSANWRTKLFNAASDWKEEIFWSVAGLSIAYFLFNRKYGGTNLDSNVNDSDERKMLRNEAPCTIEDLPLECQLLILQHLISERDLCAVAQTSHLWNERINDNTLWENRFIERWKNHDSKNGLNQSNEHHIADNNNPTTSTDWRTRFAKRYSLEQKWVFGNYIPVNLVGHDSAVYCIRLVEQSKSNSEQLAATLYSGSADSTIKIWTIETAVSQISNHKKQRDSPLTKVQQQRKSLRSSRDNSPKNNNSSSNRSSPVKTESFTTPESFNCVKTTCHYTLRKHEGAVNSLYYQNKLLVSGGGDKKIMLWNVPVDIHDQSPSHLYTIDHPINTWIQCVLFSRNNNDRIISADNDGCIQLWDTETANCVATLRGNHGNVKALMQWHDYNENLLISGGIDGNLNAWDLRTAKSVQSRTFLSPILCVAGESTSCHYRNHNNNNNNTNHNDNNNHTPFTHQNHHLFVGCSDCNIHCCDIRKMIQDPHNLKVTRLGGHMDRIYSLCYDSCLSRLVSLSSYGVVKYWRVNPSSHSINGEDSIIDSSPPVASCLSTIKYTNLIYTAQLWRGNLITGSYDATIQLWDMGTYIQ